jgi:hypothetical protein
MQLQVKYLREKIFEGVDCLDYISMSGNSQKLETHNTTITYLSFRGSVPVILSHKPSPWKTIPQLQYTMT